MLRIAITTCFSLILAVVSLFAQVPASHPGLEMCKQGKYLDAILPLENAKKESFFKNDPNVWNCLALAYLKKDDLKNAQKNAKVVSYASLTRL